MDDRIIAAMAANLQSVLVGEFAEWLSYGYTMMAIDAILNGMGPEVRRRAEAALNRAKGEVCRGDGVLRGG